MQPNKECVGSQFVLLLVNWIQSNYGEWFWYFDRIGCPNKLIEIKILFSLVGTDVQISKVDFLLQFL